jgi:hypothetical protein
MNLHYFFPGILYIIHIYNILLFVEHVMSTQVTCFKPSTVSEGKKRMSVLYVLAGVHRIVRIFTSMKI